MSRTLVTLRSLVVIVAAGILLPAAVSAQGTAVAMKSAPTRSPAEQLETIALQPKTGLGDWIEAAQALEQAAKLRADNDAQAVTDLFTAAGAYKIAGILNRARWAAQDAAKRAFKLGDVYTAATAYVAAVRLSVEMNDPDGAYLNMEHAKKLAESPKLTAVQKRSIFKQLGYPVQPFCEK